MTDPNHRWLSVVSSWTYTVRKNTATAAKMSAFINLVMGDIDYFGDVKAISDVPMMVSPSSTKSITEVVLDDGQVYEIVVRKKAQRL